MKTSHTITAVLVGLAIGIPVANRMSVAKQGEAAGAIPTTPPERPEGFSLQAVLDQRDPFPVLKTARDFKEFKNAAALRSGSPHRAASLGKQAVEQLPLAELIALLEAGELQDPNELAAAFQRWVEADPVAAYEGMQGLPLTTDQLHVARSMILSHWVKTQPEGMLALLEKQAQGERRASETQYFLSAWQNQNPGEALRFADRLAAISGSGTDAKQIGENLLTAWVAKDKEAATKWVESLPPGAAKDHFQEAMAVAHLGGLPLAEAVRWIREHPEQQAAQKRLPDILRNWLTGEPAAVLTQLAEIPENHPIWDHYATSLAQGAMSTAAMSQQTDALVKGVMALPEGAAKRKLLLGLIEGSSSGDFGLATRLLAGLPESRERVQAASWFSESLSRKDPAAAGEWLLGLEPSASRDAATDRFAATLATDHPGLAAEWADSIDDPAQASGARHVVYARWHERDPATAEKWRSTWPAEGE